MSTPDAKKHYNPSPYHIQALIAAIPLSQREIARRIGVSDRYIRSLVAGSRECSDRYIRSLVAGSRECSYPVQFCLESLRKND